MSTHIQHPDNPQRTRCGRNINGLVVFCYGPFGTCLSCINQYNADQAKREAEL
jgi:hypothetical protein